MPEGFHYIIQHQVTSCRNPKLVAMQGVEPRTLRI